MPELGHFYIINKCMEYDVVLVASGKGVRARLGYNKDFFEMKDGRTIVEHSASLFVKDKDCKKIIVVTSKNYLDLVFKHKKVVTTLGGKERKDSVCEGLKLATSEYVLIHDGNRPFLKKQALEALKKEVVKKKATILAKKVVDTVKRVEKGKIVNTIDRNYIYLAETPQAFKTSLIKDCFNKCENISFTDDASLVESLGYNVYIVEDKFNNKKLTTEADFENL